MDYSIRQFQPSDLDALKTITHDRLMNMTEMIPFPDLLTLIQHSRYYIGPDTGPTHMASFLNKQLALF